MPDPLKAGDLVRFVLATDIPAIVVDVLSSAAGEEYQVTWFDNNGMRQTGCIRRCEVRKLFANEEAAPHAHP